MLLKKIKVGYDHVSIFEWVGEINKITCRWTSLLAENNLSFS